VSGVCSAGFNTIVQPAAIAGPIFAVARCSGKFHCHKIPAEDYCLIAKKGTKGYSCVKSMARSSWRCINQSM